MKKKLAVIFGSPSPEYYVSCSVAKSLLVNLNKELYELYPIGITQKGEWYLTNAELDEIDDGEGWVNSLTNKPVVFSTSNNRELIILGNTIETIKIDVAFIPIPGLYGEDGRIPALLEMAGIPYVGSDSVSSGCCLDKAITRIFAEKIGLKLPDCIILNKTDFNNNFEYLNSQLKNWKFPFFIKPSKTGSSIGVSKILNLDEVKDAVISAFDYCDTVLIEEGIIGKEIKVALLGNKSDLKAGSVCELEANCEGSSFNDYRTKYSNDVNLKSKKNIPAHIDDKLLDLVIKQSKDIFNSLGCKDYARVDFFLSKDNELYFNEINTNPGFNPSSIYSLMFIDKGMSYSETANKLVEYALQK